MEGIHLEESSGVLLVHPDFMQTGSKRMRELSIECIFPHRPYQEVVDSIYANYVQMQQKCREKGKPLFIIPSDPLTIRQSLENMGMQEDAEFPDINNYSDIVESIAAKVGKSPDKIHLLVGGIYSDACVINHMRFLFKIIKVEEHIGRVSNNYRKDKSAAINPLRYGQLELSLTERAVNKGKNIAR
ncbi:MAG TPA: hypothetical protein VJI75_02470 [Candidatus Nanoarchaeia archaeon]|nr:hypothetical protein [Candidatus Nanoarchaeia archaeon]